MRDDLLEPDEGHGEPIHLPVAALTALLLLAGCGGEEERQRSLLIVSGRDDHGELVQESVSLSASPGGRAAAQVPAGSLVAVVETRAEWVRVRALRGGASGWVNDYFLRGAVHLVSAVRGCPLRTADGASYAPNAQVELLGYERRGGALWVRARSLEGGREGWVPARAVSELPARAGVPPPSCRG